MLVTIPVATPTVAMSVLLLTHVPPVTGLSKRALPSQISLVGRLTTGFAMMVMISLVSDVQPVVVSVYIKLDVPEVRPVTIPLSFIAAIPGLRLTHVPPETGLKLVWAPVQITFIPVMLTVGTGNTVICSGIEEQPVMVSKNVISEVPRDIPVMVPKESIVAI